MNTQKIQIQPNYSHQAAAITECQKMSMWVPNSERGNEVRSLENDIPTSLFIYFFSKNVILNGGANRIDW